MGRGQDGGISWESIAVQDGAILVENKSPQNILGLQGKLVVSI